MNKKFLLSSLLASLLLSNLQAEFPFSVPSLNSFPIESNISLPMFADSEVIITFDDDTNMTLIRSQMESLFNSFTKKEYSLIKGMHIKVPNMAFDMIKTILEKAPFANKIKTIEPNYSFRINSTNDTYYTQLWAIENTGQSVNGQKGTKDADMDIKEAWEKTKGSSDVVVAVLDTGVDYTHTDLADNMWRGNAKHGYDFAADDSGANDDDPMPEEPYDENGHFHGTHVAGIIGAVGNNSNGITGVAQDIQIMALKVFRPNGYGYTSDVLEALDYVSEQIDKGVKVAAINASYGSSGGSIGDSVDQAIQKLGDKGVVFVAASGNEGKDIDKDPIYPASYSATNIITVGSSDQNDKLSSFSNYGKNTVEVVAPGENILSTYPGNSYAFAQGTSMAAPQVTGVVALLSAVAPESSVDEKIEAIESSVEKRDSLANKITTEGRVNANEAVAILANSSTTNDAPKAQDDKASVDEDKKVLIDVLANDSDVDGDELSIVLVNNPSHGKVSVVDNKIEYTPEANYNGNDSFSYKASDKELESNEAVVNITVNAVNDAPKAQDDSAQTEYEKSLLIDVLANDSDIDGDELKITKVSQAQNGSVEIVDNKVKYTPNKGFSGEDSFSYTISDGFTQTSANVGVIVGEAKNPDLTQESNSTKETNNTEETTLPDLEDNTTQTENNSTIEDKNGTKEESTKEESTKEENSNNKNNQKKTIFPFPKVDNTLDKLPILGEEKSTKASESTSSNEKESKTDKSLEMPIIKTVKKTIDEFLSSDIKRTLFLDEDSSKEITIFNDGNHDDITIELLRTPKNGEVQFEDDKIIYTPKSGFSGVDSFEIILVNNQTQEVLEKKIKLMVAKKEKEEFSFPIMGGNEVEKPTKIIGDFIEKIEDGKHIFTLANTEAQIKVDDNSGKVKIEGIQAPIPSETLPAGTEIKVEKNKLKVKFKLLDSIKFN